MINMRVKLKYAKSRLWNIKKVKNAKWLLPGWLFYEYYMLNKYKGEGKKYSVAQGAKAEAIRLAATFSLPMPGTYEITTTGLALLKKKMENGDVDKLTLKSFRDFIPLNVDREAMNKGFKLRIKQENLESYMKIFEKGKKLYFEIMFRK